MRGLSLASILTVAALSASTGFGQVVKLIPNCGKQGDKVCISGSGWAEPLPVCRYTFAFDGANVAPDQQDGLYGPPATSFIVPAAAPGNHTVHVELRLNDPDQLLQQQDAPFLVVSPNTPDSATTAGSGTSSITLTYTPPNPSCPSSCKKIVWVQVVQRFARKTGQTDAQAVITSATDWPTFPDAAKKAMDETAAGARVDRIWGRTFPYYGVDNGGVPAGGGQNAGMTITVGNTGAPPTAATLYDAPNTPAALFPTTLNGSAVTIDKAILRFESAPFCVDGDNVGTFLGKVVKWEFHQLATQATGSVANVAVSNGQPSAQFTTALTRWVGGNPPVGQPNAGSNRGAFNLPKVATNQCIF